MWYRKLFLIGILSIVLVGCSKEDKSIGIVEANQEDTIKIGITFDTFVVERWQRDRDIFVTTSKDLGAEVMVQNSNGDPLKQASQIEYFIEKGMDVIVIVPIDSSKITAAIKKAKDNGIKVISYDRLVKNGNVDFYISFDNEQVGTLMGESLRNVLEPNSNVMMVCGPLTDNNVSYVQHGFQSVMKESNINIIDITYIEDWKAEYAGNYINENLELVSQVDAIMCGNDNLASQVIRVLAEERLAGKIYVVAQDADLDACQRIIEGTQYMTTYKSVDNLAQQAADLAVKLAKGENIEANDSMNDGKYEIPFIKLSAEMVTADTIEEVIVNSGFHLLEDIYRNSTNLENE